MTARLKASARGTMQAKVKSSQNGWLKKLFPEEDGEETDTDNACTADGATEFGPTTFDATENATEDGG